MGPDCIICVQISLDGCQLFCMVHMAWIHLFPYGILWVQITHYGSGSSWLPMGQNRCICAEICPYGSSFSCIWFHLGLDGFLLVWKDPSGIGWLLLGLDGSIWVQMAPGSLKSMGPPLVAFGSLWVWMARYWSGRIHVELDGHHGV